MLRRTRSRCILVERTSRKIPITDFVLLALRSCSTLCLPSSPSFQPYQTYLNINRGLMRVKCLLIQGIRILRCERTTEKKKIGQYHHPSSASKSQVATFEILLFDSFIQSKWPDKMVFSFSFSSIVFSAPSLLLLVSSQLVSNVCFHEKFMELFMMLTRCFLAISAAFALDISIFFIPPKLLNDNVNADNFVLNVTIFSLIYLQY
jgi:hypothetical protein